MALVSTQLALAKSYTYSDGADGDWTNHRYLTQGGKVIRETIGTGSTAKVLDFIYAESGKLFALNYSTNGGSSFTTYYYVLNLQGDVVKLINTNGTVVAKYAYNAWGENLGVTDNNGNALAFDHIGNVNPMRYRGYYYDRETGWYYLQSRYYDPVLHRFINADAAEYSAMSAYALNATNLFAYCGNNPVKNIDEGGTFFFTIIGAAVGAVCGAVSAMIDGEDVLAGAVGGAVSGAITGAAADVIAVTGGSALVVTGAMAVVSAGASVAGNVTEAAVSGKEVDWGEVATDAAFSFAFGGLTGYIGGGAPSKLAKVAKRGLTKVLVEPLKQGFKKWASSATEDLLSNALTDLGKFTGKYISRMFSQLSDEK